MIHFFVCHIYALCISHPLQTALAVWLPACSKNKAYMSMPIKMTMLVSIGYFTSGSLALCHQCINTTVSAWTEINTHEQHITVF